MKFESYHPMIQFIYFTCMILFTIWFKHPVFLVISFGCSFLYSIYLGKIHALLLNLVLIAGVIVFAAYYSYYHHFGVTVLRRNYVGNDITLEAVTYGLVLGIVTTSVIMWFSCIHRIMTTDKIVYLFGKIQPKLSLYIAIMFRLVPRVKEKAKQVNLAQECIGKGIRHGNVLKRIQNLYRIASIVVTWTLDNLVESAQSMKSRGYSLKRRTAFSIYRFDYRDRCLVIWIFLLLTIIMAGNALEQNSILYNPSIIMNKITKVSYLFYSAYFLLGVLPIVVSVNFKVKTADIKTVAFKSGKWHN